MLLYYGFGHPYIILHKCPSGYFHHSLSSRLSPFLYNYYSYANTVIHTINCAGTSKFSLMQTTPTQFTVHIENTRTKATRIVHVIPTLSRRAAGWMMVSFMQM